MCIVLSADWAQESNGTIRISVRRVKYQKVACE